MLSYEDSDVVGVMPLSGDPASFKWIPVPGLNPYNVQTRMGAALESTLFRNNVDGRPLLNSTYGSIGGSIVGMTEKWWRKECYAISLL